MNELASGSVSVVELTPAQRGVNHMTMKKRLAAAVMAAAMAFSAVPICAHAAETTVSITETTVSAPIRYTYFDTVAEAGAYVRQELKKHTDEMHIRLSSKVKSSDVFNDILSEALKETGEPTEGDFLRLTIEGYKVGQGSFDGDPCVDMIMRYNSTLEQDEAAVKKADEILAEIITDGMDNYEKIDAVYKYLTENVVYSEVRTDEVFTAYGALLNNDCVCQGFIQSLYLMLRSVGVSCRAVMGNENSHVWAIAEVEGKYYYLDPTWDSGFKGSRRLFFLKGINDFDEYLAEGGHTAGSGDPVNIAFVPDCTVEAFLPDYPISETKYIRETYLAGDINNDMVIDIFDLISAKQALIAGFKSSAAKRAADTDGDGTFAVNDVVLIQKFVQGSISSFTAEK